MVSSRYRNSVANVKGVEEATRILTEFINGIDKITQENFQELGQNIIQAASARTPIDTGRLVSNNKILKVTESMMVVGNKTPYAKYVHDGTSKMPARPFFMTPIHLATTKFPELQVKDYKQFYEELVNKNRPN